MSCKDNWAWFAKLAGQKGFVPAAGVRGVTTCSKEGCTEIVREETRLCLAGHSQDVVPGGEQGEAGTWSEDPRFPREDWQHEAAAGNTNRGYWDWVAARQEADWDEGIQSERIYRGQLLSAMLCAADSLEEQDPSLEQTREVIYARVVQELLDKNDADYSNTRQQIDAVKAVAGLLTVLEGLDLWSEDDSRIQAARAFVEQGVSEEEEEEGWGALKGSNVVSFLNYYVDDKGRMHQQFGQEDVYAFWQNVMAGVQEDLSTPELAGIGVEVTHLVDVNHEEAADVVVVASIPGQMEVVLAREQLPEQHDLSLQECIVHIADLRERARQALKKAIPDPVLSASLGPEMTIDGKGDVAAVVAASLVDIANVRHPRDLGALFAELVIGNERMTDVSYQIVGFEPPGQLGGPGRVLFQVTGNYDYAADGKFRCGGCGRLFDIGESVGGNCATCAN